MSELVGIDRATRLLARANTLVDVIKVRDYAKALQIATKRSEQSKEAWNESKKLMLRAERKAGKMLKAAEKNKGGNPKLTSNKVLPVAKLDDLNISKMESSRWQKLAGIPDDKFEELLSKAKDKPNDSEKAALALANKLADPRPKPDIPLPEGKYRTIVIDPPWPVQKIVREERPNQARPLDYPTMTVEEIKALPISELAADDGCHIYLWTTHKFLPTAFDVFHEWGVKYECLLTWVKNVGFTPFSWMYSTEHALFGRVGSLELLKKGLRLDFKGKVERHSEKPDAFYARVREASPEPRLDMYGRKSRKSFKVWGNDAE